MAEDAPSEYQHIAAKCPECGDRFTVVLRLEADTRAEGINVSCPHCGGDNSIQARAGIREKVTVGKGWTPRAQRVS